LSLDAADPSGTASLFNNEYHVSLLSADVAAFLGTWVELIAPWFLLLGLGGRLTAAFLFVYNFMRSTGRWQGSGPALCAIRERLSIM